MLEQKKKELDRASTIVECLEAMKSLDVEDFGAGHKAAGNPEHKQNILNVLYRIRLRAKPLPPALENDFQ